MEMINFSKWLINEPSQLNCSKYCATGHNNNKNQMRTADFAYFRQKRKINHINFVSKAYSPPLDRYYSLALNYDSKSKG